MAARLFAEKGFAGTSVVDIANAFGVRKATLYHWTDSKESLLTAILAGATEQTSRELGEIAARDLPAGERLRLMVIDHIDTWVRNPHNLKVAYQEAQWLPPDGRATFAGHLRAVENAYKTVIRDGTESGEFAVAPERLSIVIETLLGAVNSFPRWFNPGGWASPEQIGEIIAETFLLGLGRRA